MSFWTRLLDFLGGRRPTPVPTPTPPIPTPAPTPPPTDEAAELARWVNVLRSGDGLPPLVHDAALDAVARRYADALAASDVLRHGDEGARIGAAFPGRACGECLAEGQAGFAPEPVLSQGVLGQARRF